MSGKATTGKRGAGRKAGLRARAADLALAHDRRREAWRLRRESHSFEEIGRALGVSTKTAWKYVNDWWKEISGEIAEDAAVLRSMELEKLDAIERRWIPVALNPNLLALEPGPDGALVPVGEARSLELALRAVDRLLKVAERRARLLGLDAPERLEQRVDSAGSFRDLREAGIDPAVVSPLLRGIASGTVGGGVAESAA
jgi:DNA-binding CsgD family transcriptional regulator